MSLGPAVACSFELKQYPQINDAHARILYEAHSYISTEIYQPNDDVNVHVKPNDKYMERLESILGDMEAGFEQTKAGKALPPYDDDYVGVTHVVEASGNLTVLIRCGQDGFLKSQETSIVLPPPAVVATVSASSGSALGGVHSPRFHRLAPEIFARLCKEKEFYSQLNRAVDQYFFHLVTGEEMPLTAGETNVPKSGKGKTKMVKNSVTSSTKSSKRGRSASRSLRILGHCSPKSFVTPEGCQVFAVLWFQTDIGIGLVSAEVPQSGEFTYRCSTVQPVPVLSLSGQPMMKVATSDNTSGNVWASTGPITGITGAGPIATCTTKFHENQTRISSSPSTIAGDNVSQVNVHVSPEAMAKSRIDNIVLLLSKMRQDAEFAAAASKLMNCARTDELEAMAMNQLLAELGKYP